MFSDVRHCNPERILEMCVVQNSLISLEIEPWFEFTGKVLMKLKEKKTNPKKNRSEQHDAKFYIGFNGKWWQ